MIKAKPFVGSESLGRALDAGMAGEPTWRASFANGESWVFKATNAERAQSDAAFWADFTQRELAGVEQL